MTAKTWWIAAAREAAWAPLAVFCVFVAMAFALDVFDRYPWIDVPAHFAGGAAVAYFFRIAVERWQDEHHALTEPIRELTPLALAVAAAVLWEIGEFASDRTFATTLNRGAADTTSDLFFGFLGAVAFLAATGLTPARLRAIASAALLALIALCLSWELFLAPLRPGGSLAALKALPLTLPLYGILQGRRYTYQWASMLILAWFAEGIMRAWAERGFSQWLALAEILLSLVFFGASVAYARLTR